MNMTQYRVILQYAVSMGMAFVVGKGWLPQDVAAEVGAALVAAIPAIYAAWKSRDQGKIDTAAKVQGVTIVAPPAVATASPHDNVVSSATQKVTAK
jgi:hypothetical protein